MRETIRPSGSGRDGTAVAFLRSLSSPKAAMVLQTSADMPSDWQPLPTSGNTEGELGHALGWTLELRQQELHLLNPLGEGLAKAPLPSLSPGWLQSVRHDGSCALFLLPVGTGDDGASALAAVDLAAREGTGRSGTVRSAFSDDFGKTEAVGRNQPCPCGSGKKYKHCCA